MNRRELLKKTLIGGSFVAVSTYALWPKGEPLLCVMPKNRLSPTERLKVAIIGCGARGNRLAGLVLGSGRCTITHACDPDENHARQLMARVERVGDPAPVFAKDMRTVFDDKDVDAVVIATPNHWHALAGIWAMQAGKDVFLEKPVSHHLLAGARLVEEVERTGRFLQCGFHRRSRAPLRQAMQYLHDGHLGQIKVARSMSYKRRLPIGAAANSSPPTSVDYNLWAGPAPMSPITRKRFHYDWHWFWDYGGGGLANNGSHRIDVARWGLQVNGLGDSVTSYGGRLGPADVGQTPNTQVSVNTFGDKTIIHELRGVGGNALKPFQAGDGTIFYGEKGLLAYGSSRAAVFDFDGREIRSFDGEGYAYETHVDNFARAIMDQDKTILTSPIQEGHASSALCQLASVSHRLGAVASDEEIIAGFADSPLAETLSETFEHTRATLNSLKIDSQFTLGVPLQLSGQTVQLTNQPEANQLLAGTYRQGFELPS